MELGQGHTTVLTALESVCPQPWPWGTALASGEEGGDVQSGWSPPRTAGHIWALTCALGYWISSPSLKFLTFTGLEGGGACSRPSEAPG